jgi:UDP-N-acetylmuramate--alanine ligase
MRPAAAIVTNVEADHLENHGDLEGIHRAFEQFVDRIDRDGLLVASAEDPGARRVADYARISGLRVRTYGETEDADVRIDHVVERPDGVDFTVSGGGIPATQLRVATLVGRHMAHNAAAAFVLAVELGVDVEAAVRAWRGFQGVHRRFELRGSANGVWVYDDYAHHPTEVAAQLTAARAVVPPGGRLIAVFQPGTYSRTQTFAHEFAEAMSVADIAVVMEIFPGREEPIPGVTGALIADRITGAQVIYERHYSDVPRRIAEVAAPGDVVVTMGIGDVYLLCPEIIAAVGARAEAPHER